MSDTLQLVELRNTQHSGKQSVPPRGSEWVRSWFLKEWPNECPIRFSLSSSRTHTLNVTGMGQRSMAQ